MDTLIEHFIIPALCLFSFMGSVIMDTLRRPFLVRKGPHRLREARRGDPRLETDYRAYTRARSAEERRLHLERCLEQRGDLAELHYRYGLCLIELGDDGAVRALRRCLEIDDAHTEAYSQLAALLSSEDPAEAGLLARRALDLDPHQTLAVIPLGNSLLQNGQYAECVELLRSWLNPDGSLKVDWRNRYHRRKASPAALLAMQSLLRKAEGEMRAAPQRKALPAPDDSGLLRKSLDLQGDVGAAGCGGRERARV